MILPLSNKVRLFAFIPLRNQKLAYCYLRLNQKMNLTTNLGCPAALKVLIANRVSGQNIKVNANKKACVESIGNAKGLQTLSLKDGRTIIGADAITRYFMSKKDATIKQYLIDEILDWDSSNLQKKVVSTTLLERVQEQLRSTEERLQKSTHLLSNSISAADVVVWSSLYGCLNDFLPTETRSSFPLVCKWFDSLSKNKDFQASVKEALQGNGIESYKEYLANSAVVSRSIKSSQQKGNAADISSDKSSTNMEQERDVEGPSADQIASAKQQWNNPQPCTARKYTHPILPKKDEKNIMITSALPYVNNVPHLGNIIGCVLSADVYARYCRLRNYNVLYICGTDEYGTATETKALQEGLTPQQICDKYHKIHANVYEWFNIQFDHFGRTTTEQQTEISQDIFWKIHKNGYLIEDTVEQLFCENCERYLADRFVEGVCPFCSYEDARGDQCDSCGKLINAIELKKPRCKVCSQNPIIKNTKHIFLDLPKIEPMLKEWCNEQIEKGMWTNNARHITKGWIQDGLKPRCITRDLKWGTKVPLKGYEDKVFYVWFDAPIGYLSIMANYTSEWKQWWKNPEQVRLVQFMAKDNVPFHTVVFPCSLLGANDNYTMLNDISATEYLNYEDDKFSKSRGVGVFGDDAAATGIPADIYRFYLLYSRPESQDSVFSWAEFATRNNSELLNNLGNFINRALAFLKNNFDGKVPELSLVHDDYVFIASINRELEKYINGLEQIKIRDSLRDVLMMSKLGNQYIQANKPWVLAKGNPDERKRAGTVIGLATNVSALISLVLKPYMPVVSKEIQTQLSMSHDEFCLPQHFVQLLKSGHQISTPKPLFEKIELSKMDELKEKFKGKPKAPSAIPNKKQPVQTTTPEVSKSSENSESVDLEQSVTKQGELVRTLKTQKADKATIDKEVSVLLDLKKKLAISKGEDPNASQGKNKKKKKK